MTIKEVSEISGLSIDTLRYYEKVGLIHSVKRDKNGIRNYDQDNLNNIDFIKCMRGASLPVEVLHEYIDLCREGDSTINKRKEILVNQKDILKEKMDEMQKAYNKLLNKIEAYDEILLEKERTFKEE